MSETPADSDATLRIVTLVPAATEVVCCLGLESRLVARSHECNFPSSVGRLPVCTQTRLDSAEPSAHIDADVKQMLRQGSPLYQLREDVLRAARPTHVITQDQCQVCAVDLDQVQQAIAGMDAARPTVVSISTQGLSDLWSDLECVAAALGVVAHGERQIAQLRNRLSAVTARVPPGVVPRVACIEWMDPLMISGNWVPELVEIAGGRVISGAAGQPSATLTWESLTAAVADVIIVVPCGFSLRRTRAEWDVLAGRAEWSRLSAVQNGRVYLMDGDHFLNRPGPRLVESAEILAEILHPDHFAPDHQGSAWIPA